MSNRFGRRAQGPPTAQGQQDQYGPAQESQEQYGPRPPQGGQEQYGRPQGGQEQYGRQQGGMQTQTQEQYGRPQAGQEQYVPRPSPGYETMREPEQRAGGREARPSRGFGPQHGHGAGLLMLTGILAFLEGLAHLLSRAFFAFVPHHYAYAWSNTGWGVLHIVLGALAFVAGAAALTGLLPTRIFGAVVAVLIAIAFFLFIPYSPIMSIVIIALAAFSVWALLESRHRRV